MLKFSNMRQRVEFIYEKMALDLYYEGDYKYTLICQSNDLTYTGLDVKGLDAVLNRIWVESRSIVEVV